MVRGHSHPWNIRTPDVHFTEQGITSQRAFGVANHTTISASKNMKGFYNALKSPFKGIILGQDVFQEKKLSARLQNSHNLLNGLLWGFRAA